MNFIDIIQKKKKNELLIKEEIEYVVNEYTNGNIPDYQMSAFLMAICFNGMSNEEIVNLTMAMANSGDIMDLSRINGTTVDKHSTGGVGDKTTLIVAPIVAALGGCVAKMSGRGLGHTGGTIDKLESIKGFRILLTENELFEQVNKIGVAIVGQTGNLTPADKKIYALRDVTATVDSIPLIASSIMSKKIAAGSSCIVLDVKVGNGAFMKNVEDATNLAKEMVKIGKMVGRKTMALITNMNMPLGKNIGNSLEVIEAIEVLRGLGPKDLTELCIELATYMLMMCTKKNKEVIEEEVKECIKSGKALEKLKEMVKAQGGDIRYIDNSQNFPKAKYMQQIISNKTGYIIEFNTEKVGLVNSMLGAGRRTMEDVLDYTAGIILNKKVGEFVKQGEELASLYSSKYEDMLEAKEMFYNSIKIVDEDEYNNKYKNKMEEMTKLIYGMVK